MLRLSRHLNFARAVASATPAAPVAPVRLHPTLPEGVQRYLHFGEDVIEALRVCDALGSALLISDATGDTIHLTPALTHVFDQEPGAGRLRLEMDRTVIALAEHFASGEPSAFREIRIELATSGTRYAIRGSTLRMSWMPDCWILVAVERLSRKPLTLDDLRAEFRLTPAEARVAQLLGTGMSNSAVASSLDIRDSTARRHTERVLAKMGVRSRSEVAAKLS